MGANVGITMQDSGPSNHRHQIEREKVLRLHQQTASETNCTVTPSRGHVLLCCQMIVRAFVVQPSGCERSHDSTLGKSGFDTNMKVTLAQKGSVDLDPPGGRVTSGINTKSGVQLPTLFALLPRFCTTWLQTWSPELIFELTILTFQAEPFCGGLRARWPHIFSVPRTRV